ncbi:MAG TPA: shikimate kinase [Blastocatellia bacterium]|nr:shikimate kinase [Blastocatellia bacterium]
MSNQDNKSGLLKELGSRVRAARLESNLTIRELAERSDISIRFVVQLESGHANISIAGLTRVSEALGRPLQDIVPVPPETGTVRSEVWRILLQSSEDDLQAFHRWLIERTGRPASNFIAIIGLRGAGKSTMGPMLADRLGTEFVEVDGLIERAAGMSLGEIFMVHGEEYYRRLEREALVKLFAHSRRCVLAPGGSIVTDTGSWEMVRRRCFTIWLHATPQEFIRRLKRQGDTRPMKGSSSAIVELKSILARREPLYAEADLTVKTTAKSPSAVLEHILSMVDPKAGN